MKLEIISSDRDHAILVCDEHHNDIAEFYHSDHATVSQSYETAMMLAKALVEASASWRCISTAPRDGTPFLCFHPDDVFSPQTGIDLIWYEPSIKTYTMDGDTEVPFAGITHWMPLPTPPSRT